jgi:hypothetical protein
MRVAPLAPAWRTLCAAALAYLLLAAALTFPLILHLDTGVPHDLGDPLLSTSLLWWNAHVTPLTAAWWNGPWFHPEPGSLAFSDHRLGGSLLASPLQWAGLGPVTAYNVTLLLSFVVCAVACFALVRALTGRSDAAAIAGLAFGFNPYRMAHIEHLELLLAFGMPVSLLALHRYHETRRVSWLLALAVSILLQGLCSSYYLLFFSIFMGLWILWFMRPGEWRAVLAIAAASLLPVAILAPIYLRFAEIHRHYGFRREGFEIAFQSADVTSVLTASPMLALWGWTSALNGPEKQTFPGFAIAVLAIVGAIVAWRSRRLESDWTTRWARICALLSVVVVFTAVAAQVWGPVRTSLGPLRLSIDAIHKPLSIALLLGLLALFLSRRARDAHHRRSCLAFYGLAFCAMWLLSLGHQPRLLGLDILYRPPYAWLMALPGFDSAIRVPARFAMPAALALSVAGGLAFPRILAALRAPGPAVAVLCLLAVAADTWPSALPIREAPQPWHLPAGGDVAAVMELPFGGAEWDAAAMYRTAFHGMPTVNGMSGYLTPRYEALVRAVGAREPAALAAIAATGPVLIALDKRDGAYPSWLDYVQADPGVRAAGEDGRWRFLYLGRRVAARAVCSQRVIRPVHAYDGAGAVELAPLVDDDPATMRLTKAEQTANDVMTFDFGASASLCSLGFSLGDLAKEYPGQLRVEVSLDGQTWSPGFEGTTAGLALDAALAQPIDARVDVPLTASVARFVRLRLLRTSPSERWALAELYARADR